MPMKATVTFQVGTEYQVIGPQTGKEGVPFYTIVQNGQPYAFAFDPEIAKHVCLGLLVVDRAAGGDRWALDTLVETVRKKYSE